MKVLMCVLILSLRATVESREASKNVYEDETGWRPKYSNSEQDSHSPDYDYNGEADLPVRRKGRYDLSPQTKTQDTLENIKKDPTGWDSYYNTDPSDNDDDTENVDPSGWNYDRTTKSSASKKDWNKKKETMHFCENLMKGDGEVNDLEKKIAISVKDRVENLHNRKVGKEHETPVFIRRFVSLLLDTAGLYDKYKQDMSDISGFIEVRVSAEQLKTLINFSKSSKNISLGELDSLLSDALHSRRRDAEVSSVIENIFFLASQKEIWLPILLGFVGLVLFRMIATSRTSSGFFTSLLLLIFTAGYLVEYYRMYKEVEIRQRIILQKHPEIPESCRPAEKFWLTTLLSSLIGSQNSNEECEKYLKAVLTDPLVEVSPVRVLSSILTDFVLYPMSKLGTAIAAFTKAIMSDLPFHYGWFVWLCSSTVIVVLIILAMVMLLGGSIRLGSLFSSLTFTSQAASQRSSLPQQPPPAAEAPNNTPHPLLQATPSLNTFVLMDTNSLLELMSAPNNRVQEITQDQASGVRHRGSSIQKSSLNDLKDEMPAKPVLKQDSSEMPARSLLNVDHSTTQKDQHLLQESPSSLDMIQETVSSEIVSEAVSVGTQNGEGIPEEELVSTYEVVQSCAADCQPEESAGQKSSL